jgi:hypothetical protein
VSFAGRAAGLLVGLGLFTSAGRALGLAAGLAVGLGRPVFVAGRPELPAGVDPAVGLPLYPDPVLPPLLGRGEFTTVFPFP